MSEWEIQFKTEEKDTYDIFDPEGNYVGTQETLWDAKKEITRLAKEQRENTSST